MRFLFAAGALLLVSALLAGTTAGYDNGDYTKIIVIVLGFHENIIENEMTEIQYGHPPNLGLQQGNFTATIRAENGTALFVFDVWDPRYQLDDFGYHQVLAHHEQVENPELEAAYRASGEYEDIDLPILIPYHRDIRSVELADKNTGALLISVNVSPAVEAFCARFPRDPDMMSEPAMGSAVPLQPLGGETGIFLIAGGILGVSLLAALATLIRKA
jgi:hypothetical protein